MREPCFLRGRGRAVRRRICGSVVFAFASVRLQKEGNKSLNQHARRRVILSRGRLGRRRRRRGGRRLVLTGRVDGAPGLAHLVAHLQLGRVVTRRGAGHEATAQDTYQCRTKPERKESMRVDLFLVPTPRIQKASAVASIIASHKIYLARLL